MSASARADRPSAEEVSRQLGDIEVAKNMLHLRFCVVCNSEMSDEICCNCEAPTVAKT